MVLRDAFVSHSQLKLALSLRWVEPHPDLISFAPNDGRFATRASLRIHQGEPVENGDGGRDLQSAPSFG
jgi:hypothetical protein